MCSDGPRHFIAIAFLLLWCRIFTNFPRTSVNHISSAAPGGGTGFLIQEPFTQSPSLLPNFSSFEVSSLALKLLQSKVPFFNIYPLLLPLLNHFPALSRNSPLSFSLLPPCLTNLLSLETSTYILANPSDHLTSQFLSSFNLTQHVDFQTRNKNYSRPGNNLFWFFSGAISHYYSLHSIGPLFNIHETVSCSHITASFYVPLVPPSSLHRRVSLTVWPTAI